MAEYIEREAMLADIDAAMDNAGMGYVIGQTLKRYVKRQPAADVVEVVHSRWKYFRKQGIAVCTNCSFERELDANFGCAISCPNCGAKMDGE